MFLRSDEIASHPSFISAKAFRYRGEKLRFIYKRAERVRRKQTVVRSGRAALNNNWKKKNALCKAIKTES